jgi:hypothetical protein
LIAEVLVNDLEPIRESHHGLSRSVEHGVAAVKVQNLRGLDSRMNEILVRRVEGMINAEVLGSRRAQIASL